MSFLNSAPKTLNHINQSCQKRTNELVNVNAKNFYLFNNITNKYNDIIYNKNSNFCDCCCLDAGTSTNNDSMFVIKSNKSNNLATKRETESKNIIVKNRVINNNLNVATQQIQTSLTNLIIFLSTNNTSAINNSKNNNFNSINKIQNLKCKRLNNYTKNYCNFKLYLFKIICLLMLIIEAFDISLIAPNFLFVNGKTNEVMIDWTLNSNLFHKGSWITTKYVRMKDILRIKCAPIISFNIYMVPAEAAMYCKLPSINNVEMTSSVQSNSIYDQRIKQTIGSCAPNTVDPRVTIRSLNFLSDRPGFKEGHSYFLITTSSGTADGIDQVEDGLCKTNGMRLRLIVLNASAEIPPDELTNIYDIFPNHRRSSDIRSSPFNEKLSTIDFKEDNAARRSSHRSLKTTTDNLNKELLNLGGVEYHRQQPNLKQKILNDTPNQKNNLKPLFNNYNNIVDVDETSEIFPAILTLEDHGKLKKILIHNSKQLQDEINHARESNLRVQKIQEYISSQNYVPQYSLTGHGKISAVPITYNKNGNANSNEFTGSNSYRRNVNNRPNYFNKNNEKDLNSNLYQTSTSLLSDIEINNNFVEQQGGHQMPFTYIVGYNEEIFEPSAHSSFYRKSLTLFSIIILIILIHTLRIY